MGEVFKLNGCSVHLEFNGHKEREEGLTPFCIAVLNEFDLSGLRLCIYVAESEDRSFANPATLYYRGKYFRGSHVPPEGLHQLPDYLGSYIFRPDEELMWLDHVASFEEQLAIDHLIYVRDSTCVDTVGFVLTLAHELQHVTQYRRSRKLLAASALLYHNLKRTLDPSTTLTAIDIPHEQEANIVSKRIAERICSADAVKRYAEEQIKQFTELSFAGEEDAASERIGWEFFKTSDASVPYDLAANTIPLFRRYIPQIIAHDLGRHYGLDLTKQQWWD